MRRSLGGGRPPDPDAAYLPEGLGVAEVRRIFEREVPVPLERQFVERGAPRDGAAVRALRTLHDLAGGSAPHLDFRSLNGMNEGYAPADRRLPAKLVSVEAIKAHAPMPFAGQPIKRKGQDVVMAAASSNDRPPPPPPGAAKIARKNASAPELFLAGTPYAEALAMQQQAPVALDAAALAVLAPYAGPRRERERSPPRGDRRPLSTRNRSRERRAAAGGDQESYGQLREKAVNERSKTVPAKESFYIGDEMKRSRPVLPRNQAALKRQAAPRPAAVKREASVPAEDRRTRARGGAADAERAEMRDAAYARQARMDAAKKQAARAQTVAPKKQKTPKLYEDSAGNIKAKKKPKHQPKAKKEASSSSPPARASSRPEDRYRVRNQRTSSNSLGVSASRSRDSLRVGVAF